MFNLTKNPEARLYNKIIFLSRNKLLYKDFGLKDTFQNRINLIFIHISFIFIKVKQNNNNLQYERFYNHHREVSILEYPINQMYILQFLSQQ